MFLQRNTVLLCLQPFSGIFTSAGTFIYHIRQAHLFFNNGVLQNFTRAVCYFHQVFSSAWYIVIFVSRSWFSDKPYVFWKGSCLLVWSFDFLVAKLDFMFFSFFPGDLISFFNTLIVWNSDMLYVFVCACECERLRSCERVSLSPIVYFLHCDGTHHHGSLRGERPTFL